MTLKETGSHYAMWPADFKMYLLQQVLYLLFTPWVNNCLLATEKQKYMFNATLLYLLFPSAHSNVIYIKFQALFINA